MILCIHVSVYTICAFFTHKLYQPRRHKGASSHTKLIYSLLVITLLICIVELMHDKREMAKILSLSLCMLHTSFCTSSGLKLLIPGTNQATLTLQVVHYPWLFEKRFGSAYDEKQRESYLTLNSNDLSHIYTIHSHHLHPLCECLITQVSNISFGAEIT